MNKIKKNPFFFNIRFEIKDAYDTIETACKARLDLFQFSLPYDKILYLDTDILVKSDIQKVFDVCKKDILYVLEESTIDHEYHGKQLFGNETYEDRTAFTSGILLFNNCETIKGLFQKIKEDMINRPYEFVCHDQPYFVYNAFKYNVYDNKILKSFAVNFDFNIHSDKVIYHFPIGPGVYKDKINAMTRFLDESKDFIIQQNIDKTKEYLPILKACGFVEGMFQTEYSLKNISNLALNKNIKKGLEIGFNAFSALLILISNPTIHLTCFDVGKHSYVLPCFEKIKEIVGDRIHLILGNSTINELYDLIRIDGTQSELDASIIHAYRLSRKGTIIIMDSYDIPKVHDVWDGYVEKYVMESLDISMYECYTQDIKYVTYSIPKIVFQTNKTLPEAYVLDMILDQFTPEWRYEFYSDEHVIKFFQENPIEGFPTIIQKYNSICSESYRSDLFKYYYLYVNGGVFLESNTMLYVNINTIVKDYTFVSVLSNRQFILGAFPGNNSIKKALIHSYMGEDFYLDDTLDHNKLYEEQTSVGEYYIRDEKKIVAIHFSHKVPEPENRRSKNKTFIWKG